MSEDYWMRRQPQVGDLVTLTYPDGRVARGIVMDARPTEGSGLTLDLLTDPENEDVP